MTNRFTMEDGPTFFVIGAQRSGTTRLCGLLNRHPDITIPEKEPMFFQSPEDMAAKSAWYRQLFENAPKTAFRGDGSTYYSMCGIYPGTARRLYQFNVDARIIYLVRHPVRRIESGWVQLVSVAHANRVRGFDYTLRETPLLMDPSLYWRQISEYRRYFPDDQILILFFEAFIADERTAVDACCAFLGVDDSDLIGLGDTELRNSSIGKRQRLLLVDAVRSLPGYERVKGWIPQRAKSYFDTHLLSPIEPTVRWKPETLAWAMDRLREDSAELLRHTGRPSDYWRLD
jgi:hypothetical protein